LWVDLLAKSALVEHLSKSWDLVPSGFAEPPRVTEEQVANVEVRNASFPFLALLFLSLVNLQC